MRTLYTVAPLAIAPADRGFLELNGAPLRLDGRVETLVVGSVEADRFFERRRFPLQ